MKPVMEVCQPGVAGRSPRHGAGAGGGGHPGEGSGDGVPGGDGPPGVVDHGVVIVLPQLVVLVPPRLPVSLGVIKTRGVPLGAVRANPARLEYYDSERKWKSKAASKRQIVLEKCFNINRKLDTRDSRNKFVISLYTLDDCVSIVFETENELNDWLDQLLTLQQGKYGNIDGRKPVPNFEHVFTVNVKHFSPDENNFTQVNHLMGQQR